LEGLMSMATTTPTRTPVAEAPPPNHQPEIRRARRKANLVGWLFISPIVVSIGASLTDWNGISAPKFVGFRNFTELFGNDPLFIQTFKNTIYFTLASIPLTIGIGLVLALLCARPIRGVAFFRTAYFAPYVTNVVAI